MLSSFEAPSAAVPSAWSPGEEKGPAARATDDFRKQELMRGGMPPAAGKGCCLGVGGPRFSFCPSWRLGVCMLWHPYPFRGSAMESSSAQHHSTEQDPVSSQLCPITICEPWHYPRTEGQREARMAWLGLIPAEVFV